MDYDIAVIGAGPTGLSFALSLRDAGLRVALVEKQPQQALAAPQYDGREIALTHLSKRLMTLHGSWQRLTAEAICPLQAADVINGRSDYRLNFTAPAGDNGPLGYLVSNQHIRRAIWKPLPPAARRI